MNQDTNYIDELFAENFKGFEAMPPRDVWSSINKRLDYKTRVRNISFYSGIAAGVALIIGTFITLQNNTSKNIQANQFAEKTIQTPKITKSEIVNNSPSEKTNKTVFASKLNTTVDNNSITTEATDENIQINSGEESKSIVSENIQNNQIQLALVETESTQNNVDTITNVATNEIVAKNETIENTKQQAYAEILNPSIITEQQTEVTIPKINRWSVECQVAPMYAYRDLQATSNNTTKSDYNKNETGLVTYTGGFKVSYQTSKRLSIQTGVYYSAMGQTITNKLNTNSTQNNTVIIASNEETEPTKMMTSNSIGVITSNLETHSAKPVEVQVNESKIIQEFKYIELPILARYKLVDQKIGVHFIGGLSSNWLIKNTATLEQDGIDKGNTSTPDIRKFNYSSTFGLGLNYAIVKHLNLSIEPTCKYYLSSLSTNNQIKVYPYSLGVFSGLVYTF